MIFKVPLLVWGEGTTLLPVTGVFPVPTLLVSPFPSSCYTLVSYFLAPGFANPFKSGLTS